MSFTLTRNSKASCISSKTQFLPGTPKSISFISLIPWPLVGFNNFLTGYPAVFSGELSAISLLTFNFIFLPTLNQNKSV